MLSLSAQGLRGHLELYWVALRRELQGAIKAGLWFKGLAGYGPFSQ